ncbi:uncharacterized protein LOC131666407 [Phymastichus coffea]|uniref:uncharacterized protein LOC131666407 n=1 Tax=Phymastichus coffea TaxID=108790 RepID=UPI00273C41B5|nr:uncharacterized protein LOC131666407 [Phymastichus coffea]
MEDPETCYSSGSVAGAVLGTFLVTCLLIALAALFYRRWRRNKGKHLVLVTDPEIVDEAYAFDNPCFKDATPAMGRSLERPVSTICTTDEKQHETSTTPRWSTPWANIGKTAEKRRTLDDSYLTPKATRVCVVGLKSRDFTGLGFSVCGNMREGIFVKDLMHRGPASESGRIHPGDRISSVKISFRSMVYEDALTILSYASPYDVELEVESGGGSGSKPTTLLKKSVGPSPTRLCHPLYRSQSIPDLSQTPKLYSRQRLFEDSATLKSTKSTPGSQTLERQEKVNHHTKFGIKVLPALDGTVHRVENQNEHNTNLERRHSKKMEAVEKLVNEANQQRSNIIKKVIQVTDGIDVPDRAAEVAKHQEQSTIVMIADDVPAEVHNAAMAARGKRKSSGSELLQKAAQEMIREPAAQPTIEQQQQQQLQPVAEAKSPQKGKRKAPAPPSRSTSTDEKTMIMKLDEMQLNGDVVPVVSIDELTIKTESEEPRANNNNDKPTAASSTTAPTAPTKQRRNSESDTDSEIQHNNFTTIELNPSDITIHHTPVPESHNDEEDDVYRKAASLGDLSKYENKTTSTLERAQSLDMTDSGSKKRKTSTQPPEDISESTEDLTKIGGDKNNKLKKSSKWGTLEDAIWPSDERSRKKSATTLERSQSDVEAKHENGETSEKSAKPSDDDAAPEASLELYNLPLSKRLTQEFIEAERLFDIGEDNALARLVNDGRVLKSPTPEEVEQQFIKKHPLPGDLLAEEHLPTKKVASKLDEKPEDKASFEKAVRYFAEHAENGDFLPNAETIVSIPEPPEQLYAGKREVVEEPLSKVTLRFGCPGCDDGHDRHTCTKRRDLAQFETHYAKPISLDDEIVTVNSAKPSYVTEIKVSSASNLDDTQSADEEIVAILDSKSKQQANGKLPKKPPVPPRRTDAPRFVKTEDEDRQVVYVSEYRMREREPEKRYESSWAHLQDEQEINPWANGSQPVTSIMLGDEKSGHK